MAVKRNRWLVVSVLVVAIGAFVSIPLAVVFSGLNNSPAQTASTNQPPGEAGQPTDTADLLATLEARVKSYEIVLEREPNNQVVIEELTTALQGLVYARGQQEGVEATVEPLERLIELRPDVSDYRVLLGQTKEQLNDLDGASQEYRTVLTQEPGDVSALQALVSLLLIQDRPQAAVGLLQDTIKSAPQVNEVTPGSINVALVKALLAQVYVEEDRLNEAIRLYDEALETSDEDIRFGLLVDKALVLRELGQTAEADALFKEAEEQAPAEFKDQIRQMAAAPEEGAETAPSEETSTDEEVEPEASDVPPSAENAGEPDAPSTIEAEQ
ncbi:MAG: Tfp pilus assembly protein PilF [Leptolyngbyaceae cyanobacterium]